MSAAGRVEELADPTPEQLGEQARAFFAAHAGPRPAARGAWGVGPDAVLGLAATTGADEAAEVARARAWQAALFDAGLACIEGPREYGGRGLSAAHATAVRDAARGFDLPSTSCFLISHEIVAPALLVHGSAEQKAQWLPRIWRGEVMCCQLFSEPEAGSDLASLRTTARRDGDGWRVTGQKVWSSGAHYSQLGELLARTGPPEGLHRSITAFLVDMASPGIEVRPLRQITGSEHFNEVFLTDVLVPDSARLGPVDGGWPVARTTLGGERSVMGDEDNPTLIDPVRRLFELAAATGALSDPAIRELLGEAWAREQILRTTGARIADSGAHLGSVAKLLMTSNLEFYAEVAGRLLGRRMAVDTGSWGTYAWSQVLLAAPAHRIAGGTDEIQRDIIAERMLGLPREPRPQTRIG